MNQKESYHAGLYCRLSKDDDQQGESVSIATQRAMLTAHCRERGFDIKRRHNEKKNQPNVKNCKYSNLSTI